MIRVMKIRTADYQDKPDAVVDQVPYDFEEWYENNSIQAFLDNLEGTPSEGELYVFDREGLDALMQASKATGA